MGARQPPSPELFAVTLAALGTVDSLSSTGSGVAAELMPMLAKPSSLPTALSLLAWVG